MKSTDLLSQLSRLELSLSAFSVEELSAQEANELKYSFQSFQDELNKKLFADAEKKAKVPKPNSTGEDLMLIANVSHEIRTPLNGIIGFTDLLKESSLKPQQEEQVHAIQTASYALLDIVNELLEYSKLASGKEDFKMVEFNLYGLVRDVLYLCNTLVVHKEVTLNSEIGKGVPQVVVGDPSKLTQVLLNIIGNAIKFVDEGEIHISISKLEQNGPNIQLEFAVSDTGIGIAEDKVNKIFDTFRQAEEDTYTKYGGSGLGLSIVRKIIETFGGSISVTSNLGVGTTFKFDIPFKVGKNKVRFKEMEDIKLTPKDLNSIIDMQVLVFEDNTLNQRLIEQRLKMWNCSIHITDDADYGLQVLENNAIDVVLMDLRMPVKTGFEIAEIIRKSTNKRIRQTPIIALTADYSIQDKERCMAHGINDYLLKPFSPEELLSKLILSQKKYQGEFLVNGSNEEQPSEEGLQIEKFNLEHLLTECLNDVDLLEELVHLFKMNANEFCAQTTKHIANKDAVGVSDASHKLKAGLATFKTNNLHEIVIKIEVACQEDEHDWNKISILQDSFVLLYTKTKMAIDESLEAIKRKK